MPTFGDEAGSPCDADAVAQFGIGEVEGLRAGAGPLGLPIGGLAHGHALAIGGADGVDSVDQMSSDGDVADLEVACVEEEACEIVGVVEEGVVVDGVEDHRILDNPYGGIVAATPADIVGVAVDPSVLHIHGDSIVVLAEDDLETIGGVIVVGQELYGHAVCVAMKDVASLGREREYGLSGGGGAVVDGERGIAARMGQVAVGLNDVAALGGGGMEGVCGVACGGIGSRRASVVVDLGIAHGRVCMPDSRHEDGLPV